ncbi:MAG TPA: methyltransferase domain-containing protein, partial [Streptosporangiaceae bacterium]|nr:methyltransferase domain-containing protein [Streptosporangiaceae bacterium]
MNPVANGGDPADPAEYGDHIADVYDEWHGERDEISPVVDFLATCAGETRDQPVLELGIGTGRIALPLAARGLRVDGIDASARMVARLRGKPGGA